ncbi:MAG: AraC family transcriptional regulator [Fimbriimonas sp.]|nr:AraC family transcriptional regulator [Fimbriimonas sp.]
MNRYYRIDLGEPPRVRLLGFMHFEDGERRWQIPPDLWHLMMPDHPGILRLGSRIHPFEGGSVLLLPPRAAVRLSFEDPSMSGHWYSLFGMPGGHACSVAVATVSDLGLEYHWWRDRFTFLTSWSHITDAHRAPHIWSILWRIARPAEEIRLHPYLRMAESIMRENLSKPLRIDALCEELQVSQSHLNRLFVEEFGVGPKRFLLDMRVSKAVSLLRGTTKPLKEIALEVGISDMQQFNKTLRQSIGLSPTGIRHSADSHADYSIATPEAGLLPEDRPEYGRKNSLKAIKPRP